MNTWREIQREEKERRREGEKDVPKSKENATQKPKMHTRLLVGKLNS